MQHRFAACFDGRLASELREAGAAVTDLGEVRFSRPPTVWRARRRLRLQLADDAIDAVVAHGAWAYALVAPVGRGTARVLWAHDAATGTHWTERSLLQHVPSLVICNSAFTERALSAWLPPAPRSVVYAPVSVGAAEGGARTAVRREIGEASGRTVILMASRFERWKGHADLLHAAAALRGDWSIWIAGGAQRPEEHTYVAELARLCEQHGIASRVRFLGHRSDVPRLMRAADVYCQPNTGPEPFGIVFVEALLSGLPVVTTAQGGAVEIVSPECGVLVPPGDADALRETLQSFVDHPERRQALATAGPSRARRLCDPVRQLQAIDSAVGATVHLGVHNSGRAAAGTEGLRR